VFDGESTLAEIEGCEREIAAAQARQLRALARFAALRSDPNSGRIDEFAPDEIAPLLRISRNAAMVRLELAVELETRLPGTLTALERGAIDLHKARIVAELTRPLSAEHAADVERHVLVGAAGQTSGQLRAATRRAVLRVDPHGADARHRHRVGQRKVVVHAGEEGTVHLVASDLDAADATAIYQRLDDLARAATPGDVRSMDQRRADILVDLLLGRTTGHGPGRARIHVTVAASTLLGLDELPGELAGHGPIPARTARELASDGTWRRILTDPASGTVLDVGRKTYRPSAALADYARIRDRTCRFPGCRQPARRCDVDHNEAYPQGATEPGNLCCLCRHHHRLKHRGQWSMSHEPDGTITWTSPTGRPYTTTPEPVATGDRQAS